MAVTVDEVRKNIPELNYTEVNGDFIIKDADIQIALDEAVVLISNIRLKSSNSIPAATRDILIRYLAQHISVMNLKETTSLSLPNNSEGWKAKLNDLNLDQTVPGQMFKTLISNYTDDFASAEELATRPQHYLRFYS